MNLSDYCSYGKGFILRLLLHLQSMAHIHCDTGNLLTTTQREALKKKKRLQEYKHLKKEPDRPQGDFTRDSGVQGGTFNWLLLSRSHTETQSLCESMTPASFLLSMHPERYFKNLSLSLYLNSFPFVFLVLYEEQQSLCSLACRTLPSPNFFCKWHVCLWIFVPKKKGSTYWLQMIHNGLVDHW